uniref:Uncharacterized protein n=1 Tax=Lactuca sativa TaxID=4236 RepID=A0A9R1WIG0_LACSA|nr:hypothetical protein LSAT_V11C200078260 [Lactuca sativa]
MGHLRFDTYFVLRIKGLVKALSECYVCFPFGSHVVCKTYKRHRFVVNKVVQRLSIYPLLFQFLLFFCLHICAVNKRGCKLSFILLHRSLGLSFMNHVLKTLIFLQLLYFYWM